MSARLASGCYFEMNRRYDHDGDEPRVGGGLIAAFLLLLLACLGAFGAASAGAFKPAPPARMIVAPGQLDSVLERGLAPQGKATNRHGRRLPHWNH